MYPFRNAVSSCMTADQRLDQLEPLLSEAMTILDRHTAQLKQLTNAASQLTAIAVQQSDNIAFLLREHIIIKADVATLKSDVATLTSDVATIKTNVADLKSDVADLKRGQSDMNSKLDLILSKLK